MNILNKLIKRDYNVSYSQCGEDLIVDFIFQNYLKIQEPAYLDIGAHHPTYLSNTYFFYKRGCNGVCVEPDPVLHAEFRRKRKRDIVLNVGVGIDQQNFADFYIMSCKTLNTFSKREAERYQSYGNQKIERIIQIPLSPLSAIIEDNFSSCPNFISLDVEGLDLEIVRAFDFARFAPEVFCIETLTYTENHSENKITEIIDHMISHNYMVYADTYINTIFVNKAAWENRRKEN